MIIIRIKLRRRRFRPNAAGVSMPARASCIVRRIAVPLLLVLALAPAAQAEFKLHYPIIDYREWELEHNGDVSFDKRKSPLDNEQSYTNEIGYGVTPWWEPELEGEWAAAPGPGGNVHFDATTFENTFQLTPQGEYWADLGFFAEFSHAAARNDPDSVTFGPLVQKETELLGVDFLHTANLLFSKQIGHNRADATPVAFAWQSLLRLDPLFQPGIEYYGQLNNIENATQIDDPLHRVGPVVVGFYNMYQYGKLKYEIGYQFGLTNATEKGVARWRLEYEKPF
jgi:hypothetical protein